MSTVVIHTLTEKTKLEKIKEDDIITFDDCHCSVLDNIHLLDGYTNKKILFISPYLISGFSRNASSSRYYMEDWYCYGNSQFLNIDEIYLLINKYSFDIGMHSFFHDIVYVPGKQSKRTWRYYKLQKPLWSVFSAVSKYANIGYDRYGSKIRERTFSEYIDYIHFDTELCISWFRQYLWFTPNYAFPFFESSEDYIRILNSYGLCKQFGIREDL